MMWRGVRNWPFWLICSITSSGFEIPPDQNASQMRSI
jgi:hypothetical protein